MEFTTGKKVQHAYTKEYLWILGEDKTTSQILCRTKDLREIWFYSHELEEIPASSMQENLRSSKRFL